MKTVTFLRTHVPVYSTGKVPSTHYAKEGNTSGHVDILSLLIILLFKEHAEVYQTEGITLFLTILPYLVLFWGEPSRISSPLHQLEFVCRSCILLSWAKKRLKQNLTWFWHFYPYLNLWNMPSASYITIIET